MVPNFGKTAIIVALALAAGATAGALSSYAIASRGPTAVASGPVQGSSPPASQAVPEVSSLVDFERRLAELQPNPATSAVVADPGPVVAAVAPPAPIDRLSEHNNTIAAHWKQAADPSWAPTTTKNFRSDLADIAGAKHLFSISKVDCRVTSCVAELEFENFDAAKNDGISPLLHHDYAAKCGVRVFLEQPVSTAARFSTTVVYDCLHERTK